MEIYGLSGIVVSIRGILATTDRHDPGGWVKLDEGSFRCAIECIPNCVSTSKPFHREVVSERTSCSATTCGQSAERDGFRAIVVHADNPTTTSLLIQRVWLVAVLGVRKGVAALSPGTWSISVKPVTKLLCQIIIRIWALRSFSQAFSSHPSVSLNY